MDALDRDLLVLESRLFREVGFASQKLVQQSGTLSGTTLTLPGANLATRGVQAGMVALLSSGDEVTTCEIVSVTGATTCAVSAVRGDRAGSAIAPVIAPGSVGVVVFTFTPQLVMAREEIARLASLEEGEAIVPDGRGRLLQCVLALRDVYQVAAAGGLAEGGLREKQRWYEQRARTETMRCVLGVEQAGGEALERRLFVGRLVRE